MISDKISSRQMIIMLVVFRVTMSLSNLPIVTFPPANQDIWIIILLSFFYTTLTYIPLVFLTNKFSECDMIEYYTTIFGKWIGKLVNIIYGIYFLIYTIYLVLLEQQLVGVSFLPNTPNWLGITALLLASVYIGTKGLVLMYWSGELMTSIAFLGIFMLLTLGIQNTDFSLLLPILKDSTIKEINHGAFLTSLVFVDGFVLSMGSKHLEDKRDIKKVFFKSIFYSIIFVTVSIILIQTALGIEETKRTIYPFLIYTRLIKYDALIERIDVLYVVIWTIVHVGKVSTYMLFSLISFKKVFDFKRDLYVLVIISVTIGVIVNYFSKNIVGTINITVLKGVLYIPFIFTTVIPSFACVVYFFRRKNLKKLNL